jgi:pimeloyl-ACP methyl ester carboxylesterase
MQSTSPLASQSFGSPSDPPLVLIMGATASMLGWPIALCRMLADHGLYVVRFDHRDTGQSPTCPPGAPNYTVEDMAADVLSVMETHSLPKAHLMGMSLGGYLAQMLALTDPDRVLSLTLIGSEPLGWDGPPLPHIAPRIMDHFCNLATLDWANRNGVIAFLTETEALMAGSGAPFDAAAARDYATATLDRATSPASMFNHAQLTSTQDWTGAFRKITQPTLVMTGTDDPVLPADNARALAAGIPDATLHLLPGIGHELPPRCHADIAARVSALVHAMPDPV